MTTTSTEDRWHRPGLVGPIILIAIGIAFLLSNMGILSVAWWDLLRFWPLLLVLIGLDILSRHSRWGTAVVALVSLALVGGVFYWLAQPGASDSGFGFRAERLVANPVVQDLGGAEKVTVDLRLGAGELRLGALSDSANIMEGSLDYPQSWASKPRVSYNLTNGTGRLYIETQSRRNVWVFPFATRPTGERWTVNLNSGVPLSLEVDAGASSSVLDLRRLQVTDVNINAGVGRMEILFSPEGGHMTADIDGGVGQIVLRIPDELAVRMVVHGGLGSVNVPSRFEHHGNVYETEDYSTATNRLDVTVDGGVGSIRIE